MIGLVLAAQIAIVARGPDSAQTCAPIELSVAARARGTVAPRISFAPSAAVQVMRESFVARVERDAGGETVATTDATITVATSEVGRVTLPALVATVASASAHAAPVVVDVSPSDATTPAVFVRASLDAGAGTRADTVYVGQQVDYVVDVQLNETARQRLRRNPTFFSPDMPSVLAFDLPAPAPVARDTHRCFETLSYRRALFPLFPGVVAIPPATLAYSLPLSTSFFSREESYELRTEQVQLVALEPPAANRPADFLGAVGELHVTSQLASRSGRMGDPMLLTLRLEGTGNVKLLPRPALSLDWATIAPGDERVTLDTTSAVVRGVKELDWLLTPRRAGTLIVPRLRYPYFDPRQGRYDVAVTDSLVLDVASASLASADTTLATRLPVRRVMRAERGADLVSREWYWIALLLAPAPATLRRAMTRRRRRRAGVSPARRLRKLATSRAPVAPRELRRAYLDALRARVPALGDTSARMPLGRALRYAGVTDATAQHAEQLLAALDVAAFSPAGNAERALVERSVAVAAAVDAEAVRAPGMRATTGVVLLVAALTGAHLVAQPVGVARAFGDGVRAYERGDFTSAQRLFARAASRAPRAEDAWANLGAAAWSRGDTAYAALGWQRALRLDPLDGDVRDRLADVQSASAGAAGYVVPMPADAPALAGLALWILAWLSLAVPPSRRLANLRGAAAGALVVAAVAFLGALELRHRATARGLGVVRGGRELLETPTPSSAAAATVSAGEVGALGVREGAWVRLRIDGARAGWLPVAAVLPLDDGGAD